MAFPNFGNWSSSTGIAGLLSLPNSSYPYFWAWILAGVWAIVVLNSYFREKRDLVKSNILSSMAVASLAILVLATVGSLVGFISLEIMLYVLAIFIITGALWWFAGRE